MHRLLADPGIRILITGYNERFARKLGRKARNLAGQHLLVAGDKGGADEWETAAGGGVMTRGVGSPPTGSGFNLILIDDPIRKREDAESENFREKLWDWYTDDLYTRLEPEGAIVLTLTRWGHDDLAARALASEKWTVLRLPALAEEGDPLGRAPGEALWPERYDREALLKIRAVISQNDGLASWEALYQQNPTPREGAFFKVVQLQIVDEVPAGLRTVRAWDLAASAGKGDWSAGVKIEGPDKDGLRYITDVKRGQWSTDDRDKEMKQTAALDGRGCHIQLSQDPGQAGVSQVEALVKMLAGYSVDSNRETGAKEVRAGPVSSQINAKNFRLQAGEWNKDFIEELRQFPLGKHDDQVDALSSGFNWLTQRSGRGAHSF